MVFFYLSGRPVGQLAIDGAAAETWTYVTTDHLGTPLLATDDTGGLTWEGGFEAFGRDYQAGTAGGALENELFLRLPGQWEDGTWADATSGAGLYYNVHRWLEWQTARFSRPDPLGILRPHALAHPSAFAQANPIRFFDPLGLDALTENPDVQDCFLCLLKGANFGVSGVTLQLDEGAEEEVQEEVP